MLGRLALLALLAPGPAAHAHPLAPCVLEVHEGADGGADVGWKTPLARPRGVEIEPRLPARCREVAPRTVAVEGAGIWTRWRVACGPGGLVGERIGVTGPLAAVVRVTLADGRLVQGVLTAADPALTIPSRPRGLDVARDYVRLGVGHILAGPDHLLFVFGLVLLAGTMRSLLATVTAFTLGHSVTLTLATLGIVALPGRLIEVAIAASVLALAVELARPPARPTLVRRRPWLMAAAFGLLHGLGFAAALHEAGLPAGDIPLALVAFNVGIELGQLAFVAAALAARPLAPRMPVWIRQAGVYAMGALAGSWWLERTIALLR